MLAGAASCSAWDVVEMLRKRRVALRELDVEIEGFQADEPPWHYERVVLHFRVACERLTVGVLERVIRLSVVRYCSVIATLRGVARIEATLELVDGAGSSTGRLPVRLDDPVAVRDELVEPSPPPAADEA
jgi:putative redox protein